MFKVGDIVYYGNVKCKVTKIIQSSVISSQDVITILPVGAPDRTESFSVIPSMIDTEEEFETVQRVLSQFPLEPVPWPDGGEHHKSCKECKEEK